METLSWIAAGFILLLSAYALFCCWRDKDEPTKHRIIYTVVILLLPIFGAVIFFKQREEMRRNTKPRSKRRL
ncbi:MAG: hypothetical protein CMO61_06815 [Verrucomicrobiales bacterium]|jgi:hypothetical protein|nr:hypothetical protein [Verrucomicrobiales bacterium]